MHLKYKFHQSSTHKLFLDCNFFLWEVEGFVVIFEDLKRPLLGYFTRAVSTYMLAFSEIMSITY